MECYDGGYTFLITKSEADEFDGEFDETSGEFESKFDMASDAAAGEE